MEIEKKGVQAETELERLWEEIHGENEEEEAEGGRTTMKPSTKGSLLGTVFSGLVSLHTGSPGFLIGSGTVTATLFILGDNKKKEIEKA